MNAITSEVKVENDFCNFSLKKKSSGFETHKRLHYHCINNVGYLEEFRNITYIFQRRKEGTEGRQRGQRRETTSCTFLFFSMKIMVTFRFVSLFWHYGCHIVALILVFVLQVFCEIKSLLQVDYSNDCKMLSQNCFTSII